MAPFVVEAVPAAASCAFPVAFQILLVAVHVEVVFAGNIEHLSPVLTSLSISATASNWCGLARCVMSPVCRTKAGALGQSVDPGDRQLERGRDVLVRLAGRIRDGCR